VSTRPFLRLVLLIGLATLALLFATGRWQLPVGCQTPAGCETLLVEGQSYEPIPIQPGAKGRIVASTVDVHAVRREGDLLITSMGTGVVVDADGLIVTADHVVTPSDGSVEASIEVIAADGRVADAVLVARVPANDLAFVRADLAGLRPATLAPDLERLSPGDRVLAVGAPHNFERFVARGRVLAVLESGVLVEGRDLGTLIQTSARIRRGFSGGPVADTRGRLIGITVGSTDPAGDCRRTAVAVPAQVVASALAAL
jgi:S1-C subfamily serine protease